LITQDFDHFFFLYCPSLKKKAVDLRKRNRKNGKKKIKRRKKKEKEKKDKEEEERGKGKEAKKRRMGNIAPHAKGSMNGSFGEEAPQKKEKMERENSEETTEARSLKGRLTNSWRIGVLTTKLKKKEWPWFR
jgi:hypothetical protein